MGTIVEGNILTVFEYFYSIQGEGIHCGRAAFFIRLAGCNVGCVWCDSKDSRNINNGKQMSVEQLCSLVSESGASVVVITGGEPMIHNLDLLCAALKRIGVKIHLETSGSEPFSGNFDWITLSPKKRKQPLAIYFNLAHELKVVIENEADFALAEEYATKVKSSCVLLMQTEWGVRDNILHQIIEYIKKNSSWRLSLQTHKFIGVE